MSNVLNSIKYFVKPFSMSDSSFQFQQIRNKFAGWKMVKDYNKRQTLKKHGFERFSINMLRKNQVLPPELREIAGKEIAAFPKDAAINRLVCRCIFTSRPRGVVKNYRVSRIVWRQLADYNQLSGIQRAFW